MLRSATQMSRLMGKPTICIGENKDADQLIRAFVFATRIVQFLVYLNPVFQASSSFLCLYRSICVRPGRKPHCWFSHEVAQITIYMAAPITIIWSTHVHSVAILSEFPKCKHARFLSLFFSSKQH